MVINILNIYMVYLMCTSSRGVFSYLDFRGVLVQVTSSSHRVTSTLIMRTTSYAEPILIEEVVEVMVVVMVEMV
jgi:hypothetical protein